MDLPVLPDPGAKKPFSHPEHAFCHSPGAKSLILHPEVCSIHSTDGY